MGNIGRSTSKSNYYYLFNKFDEKEDSYFLKYVFCPRKAEFSYPGKSPLNNNYQYYESNIDKHIEIDLSNRKEYNEEVVVKWYKTYFLISEKQRNEWSRLILMILSFEITIKDI
jgi:hypothetical protein